MGNDVMFGAVPDDTGALRELDREVDVYIAYLHDVFAAPDMNVSADDPRRNAMRIEAHVVPAHATAGSVAGPSRFMESALPDDPSGD